MRSVEPIDRSVAAPDRGIEDLPREIAFGKPRALARSAATVRSELR